MEVERDGWRGHRGRLVAAVAVVVGANLLTLVITGYSSTAPATPVPEAGVSSSAPSTASSTASTPGPPATLLPAAPHTSFSCYCQAEGRPEAAPPYPSGSVGQYVSPWPRT